MVWRVRNHNERLSAFIKSIFLTRDTRLYNSAHKQTQDNVNDIACHAADELILVKY